MNVTLLSSPARDKDGGKESPLLNGGGGVGVN